MADNENLLSVDRLSTCFRTQDGVATAVQDVSFVIPKGKTFALVGESGCGKSVTALSIMRLIPDPPGKITDGKIFFDGNDLLKLPENKIRQVRGNRIAMIFQEPMTSLNPVFTVGDQIVEAITLHQKKVTMRRGPRRSKFCGRLESPIRSSGSGNIRIRCRAGCGSG